MRDHHYAQALFIEDCDGKAARKAAFWRWCFAVAAVVAAYGAVLAGFYGFRYEGERLAGSSPALMLEFAVEPTAPVSQIVAETLQAEQTADSAPERREKQAEESVKPEQAEKADFAAKQDKAEEKAPAKAAAKPLQTAARQPHPRKSAAPEIAAKTGKNFAAARASAEAGFNGKSEKVWADLVYRKIQSVGRRLQRQLPGARGVTYIAFRYDAAGKIAGAHISRSSGNARIDSLAVRIVETASPLPVPPAAGGKIIPIRVN